MKIGLLGKHTIVKLQVDWFSECCFSLAVLNITAHKKKFVFEIGLAGVTFLFMADWAQNLLQDFKKN